MLSRSDRQSFRKELHRLEKVFRYDTLVLPADWVADLFKVSPDVVNGWVKNGLIETRQLDFSGSRHQSVTLDSLKSHAASWKPHEDIPVTQRQYEPFFNPARDYIQVFPAGDKVCLQICWDYQLPTMRFQKTGVFTSELSHTAAVTLTLKLYQLLKAAGAIDAEHAAADAAPEVAQYQIDELLDDVA